MVMEKKGFTIIEILIALAIASIVMAAAYSLYIVFYKQTSAQDLLIEAQQNARAGIEIMQKEFINAGYRVPSGVDPVTEAGDHVFEFRYVDESGKGLKVKYGTVDVGGVVYLYKSACEANTSFTNECTNSDYTDKNKIIPYLKDINSLTFKYYDIEGNQTTDKSKIRFAKATLTTVTKSKLPTTNATKTVEVSMEIRLRNIGISLSTADVTPPDQPKELQAREVKIGTRSGICGQLKLKWKKGAEGDLAGYKIFYTLGASTWSVSASLTDLGNCSDGYCTYTLAPAGEGALKCSESDGDPVNTYSIGIRAYDNYYNLSILSTEASGNPDTSNYTFDSGTNDTTINPSKPLAVTNFKAKDGPSDNQVEISWSYDKTNNPDVVGFRIYRKINAPFSPADYPLSSGGDITLIAAEKDIEGATKIDASYTSFIDKDLMGCTTYYYAIAPVNCDETLIAATDAKENGDNTKYVSSDYAITYGDGTGGMVDLPDGSDTTPRDKGKPPAPTLVPTAGWKRVFLALQNPTLGTTKDFDHSLVYVNKGGVCPTVDTTDGSPTYGVISNGVPVPNSDMGVAGQFKTPGTVDVDYLTHVEMCTNSTCSGTPLNGPTPKLDNDTEYCYLAVAYDKCGNPTPIEKLVTTLAEMCGDDPVGPPGDGSKGGKLWPTGSTPITVTGCDSKSGVEVSWQTMDHTYPNGYFDGALYRVHMKMGDASDFSPGYDPKTPSTLITYAQAPNTASSTLSSGTITSGISDGQTYSFGVVATDCVYENDTAGHPNNYSGWLTKSDITPGRISRDEKQNTDKDSHREALTGVTLNSSEPYSTPRVEASIEAADNSETSYKHHTVTLFFENTQANTGTSDNNMVIQRLSVSWTNPSAFLRGVTIGGGKSGLAVTTSSIDQSATSAITNDPYIRGVSNYDITDATIPGGTRWVPITFEFKDGSSNPIDMRGDQFLITLNIKNGSTKTTSCESYLTISGNVEFSGIPVPLGPTINTVSQTNPISSAFAVPGAENNSVPTDGTYNPTRQASGGQDVTVTAFVTDQDVAVSSVKVYWIDTPITQGSAPTSAASYHAVSMTQSGNQWSGTIPVTDVSSLPRRIWYYVVAEDTDGNYDRAPEMREGYYTYDWKPFDRCDVTPKAPTSLTFQNPYSTDPKTFVSVTWPKVTKYTNGGNINKAVDPIKYQVWRRSSVGGGFTKLYEVPDNVTDDAWHNVPKVDPSTGAWYRCNADDCDWWDYVDTVANDLAYYVVAQNSCDDANDKNSSDQTNRYRECQGATSAVISVAPTTITSGDAYTVTVSDCNLAATSPNDTVVNAITVKNISSACLINYDLSLTETGTDTGQFVGTVGTTRSTTDSSKVCVSAGDLAADTIAVSCPGCNGPPATRQVTVNAAACDNDPEAPTGLSGSVPTTGPDKDSVVNLSWTASASPDRAKYRIFRKTGAGGTFSQIAEVVTSASGTITYRDALGKAAIAANNYYYYVVAIDSCTIDPYANGRVSAPTSTIGPF